MAKVNLSVALNGASGSIGDMVLRRHKGGVVWQKQPQRKKPWSGAQKAHRKTFVSHVVYARSVRENPEWRAAYRASGARRKRPLNFYQAALRDHATPPTISSVFCPGYEPSRGGQLEISAWDDFQVARVHVAERDAAGNLVAAGEARGGHGSWSYTILPSAAGANPVTNVVVTAFDRPGNFAIGEFDLMKRSKGYNECAPFGA